MKLTYFMLVAMTSLGIGVVIMMFSFTVAGLILLMSLLIFLLSGLTAWLRYRHYGLMDPFLLFTLFFALYNGPFLLEVAWSISKGITPSSMFPVEFTSETYLKAALASCFAAAGLHFSAVFVSLGHKKKRNTAVQSIIPTPWVGILVFFFGLVLFILDLQRIGGFWSSLSLPREVRLNLLSELRFNLPYAPFLFSGLACVWLDYARGYLRGFWALGFLGLWCSLMLIQGDRRFLSYAILIAIAAYTAVRYPKLRIKLKFALAFTVIFVAFAFFSQARWLIQRLISGQMSLREAMEWVKQNASPLSLLPGKNEFAGPYFTLLYSIEYLYPTDTPLLGASYLQAVPNLLPRSLYPGDKPSTLDFAFADLIHQRYMSWREATIGWGYSPVAEAYNNFRLWGIPLVFFVIGLFWEWVARLRYKNWVGILLYALLIPQTLNLNRTTIAWSFQEGVYFTGALFSVLVLRALLLPISRGKAFVERTPESR
jgi:hypothetical protein